MLNWVAYTACAWPAAVVVSGVARVWDPAAPLVQGQGWVWSLQYPGLIPCHPGPTPWTHTLTPWTLEDVAGRNLKARPHAHTCLPCSV